MVDLKATSPNMVLPAPLEVMEEAIMTSLQTWPDDACTFMAHRIGESNVEPSL